MPPMIQIMVSNEYLGQSVVLLGWTTKYGSERKRCPGLNGNEFERTRNSKTGDCRRA